MATYPLRLESLDGKTKKYWEVDVDGSTITLTFGKIGKDGDKKVVKMESEEAAKKWAADRATIKREKGYKDVVQEPKKKKRKVFSDDDEESGDDWAEQGDEVDLEEIDQTVIIQGGRPKRGAALRAQQSIRAELALNPNLGASADEEDEEDHHGNAEEDEKLKDDDEDDEL